MRTRPLPLLALVLTASPALAQPRRPRPAARVDVNVNVAVSVAPPSAPAPRFTALAVGPMISCATLADRTARCWGWNQPAHPLRAATGPAEVRQLAVTGFGVCALTGDAAVRCWGGSRAGEHGNGQTSSQRSEAAVVRGLSDVAEVAGATHHACARTQRGEVWCWGQGGMGALGDGTTEQRLDPVRVVDLPPVAKLRLGTYTSCAITAAGELWCWGRNATRQLDAQAPASVPRAMRVAANVVDAGVGHETLCVVARDGAVLCRGEQMERAGRPIADAFTPVAGVRNAVAVRAGSRFACALQRDGRVVCWGDNTNGQLGREGVGDLRAAPVAGLDGVTQLEGSVAHTCALTRRGEVRCWGRNEAGQLGDGGTANASRPVAVVDRGD